MIEIIYERRETRFEAFPAENYVDYMTNVMPIPETHLFYIQNRKKVVSCVVRAEENGEKECAWMVEECDKIPDETRIKVDAAKMDDVLALLIVGDEPRRCGLCDEVLGGYIESSK